MKKLNKYRLILMIVFGVILNTLNIQGITAQDVKKSKVRIKPTYIKVMGDNSFVNINATAKVDKKNVKVSNIELVLFNKIEDDEIELGKIITNINGEGEFIIKDLKEIQKDSSNTFNFVIYFLGNDHFKKAKKKISFKDASIEAQWVVEDSINYISARLFDPVSKEPIADESLTIRVERLYRPLVIGDEFNSTDEDGTIFVPIEDGIPGINGNLTIEVVLNESENYETVKAIVNAPIGIPIVDESTFDKRTMWSPRNKTPIFMLIFPNLLIAGIWGILIYLIINLFKISKS